MIVGNLPSKAPPGPPGPRYSWLSRSSIVGHGFLAHGLWRTAWHTAWHTTSWHASRHALYSVSE